MQWKQLHEQDGQRTYAVVLSTGDDVLAGLDRFAREQKLGGAHFTAIGAFIDARLGYFDIERKDYLPIAINEQTEVLALVGDIARQDGEPRIHAHVVLGLRDGTTRGGHLLQAHVRPTLEIVLIESPRHLERRHDPATGLHLIRME